MQTRTGRPREFNADEAVDAAMRVFWAKGYEGASMADLTEAMAINRSSMYAAFGCKQKLFSKVLERYRRGPLSYIARALDRSDLGEVVDCLFQGTVDLLVNPVNPTGCLSIQGALTTGEHGKAARDELIGFRKDGELAIQDRFDRAQADGAIRAKLPTGLLARHVALIMAGLVVQAVNGSEETELRDSARLALRLISYEICNPADGNEA